MNDYDTRAINAPKRQELIDRFSETHEPIYVTPDNQATEREYLINSEEYFALRESRLDAPTDIYHLENERKAPAVRGDRVKANLRMLIGRSIRKKGIDQNLDYWQRLQDKWESESYKDRSDTDLEEENTSC